MNEMRIVGRLSERVLNIIEQDIILAEQDMEEEGRRLKWMSEIGIKMLKVSKMDMWDAMEKQLKDNIAHNSVLKDHVRWKGERDGKLVVTTFYDINLNREFRASGMGKDEFAIQHCVNLYDKFPRMKLPDKSIFIKHSLNQF